MAARRRRPKRQVKVDLTEDREKILLYLAEATESISTNGLNKGGISIGALVRRICEGQVTLLYQGRKIQLPIKFFLKL